MRKPVKKIIYSILGTIFIIVAICFGITAKDPFIIPIHTNELLFTTTFDSSVIGNEKYIIFGKMEYIRISNNDTSFSVTMVHRFR